ncbi:Cullin repeat-like-containing domain protein [Mycena floridula]|nr:Cullin repeat-like-containing domain protein [Mycena floridula]
MSVRGKIDTNSEIADETWVAIKPGIDRILNKPGSRIATYAEYSDIATKVYNCIKRRSAPLSARFYSLLKEHLVCHAESRRAILTKPEGEELIRCYSVEWDRYTSSMRYLNRLLDIVNRFWIEPERQTRRGDELNEVLTIDLLGIDIWKRVVLLPTKPALNIAMSLMIQQERDGVAIDRALITNIVDSFIATGVLERPQGSLRDEEDRTERYLSGSDVVQFSST